MTTLASPRRRQANLIGRIIRFRSIVTLWIVGLYLVLDWGFMLLRVPPGSDFGVPAGELLILFYLITLPLDFKLLGAFAAAAPMSALIVWWSIGGVRLVIGAAIYGGWAMRDATSLLESSFLWIGFLVATYAGSGQSIWRWFDRVLSAGLCVALTYPFRGAIQAVSPKIPAVAGTPTPLFFSYTLSGLITLTTVLREMLLDRKVFGIPVTVFAGLLIIYVAALLQERTVYLQAFLILGLCAVLQPSDAFRRLTPALTGVFVGVFILAAVLSSGIPIPGRFGENITIDFYVHHFEAIWGAGADDASSSAHGSAVGVGQRFFWWSAIWRELLSSAYNLVFGLGYGISLVGLAHDPTIATAVREPHNSLMSALGRTGLVGLLAYISVHIGLIWTVVKAYRDSHPVANREDRRWLLITLGFVLMCWIDAMGEDAFEKPFVCIPYYFLCGTVLCLQLRRVRFAAAERVGRQTWRFHHVFGRDWRAPLDRPVRTASCGVGPTKCER